jgi:primosomal protein N' (replication factor Y)
VELTIPLCIPVKLAEIIIFTQLNFGTERIEEELQEVFPEAKISRMDIDTVRGKHAHDNLIQQFEQQRVDILVGTQMVVKGLDFDNVVLVGILDADAILGFTDFRVNERGFQLMEQVSGRAGRKHEQGKVLIQVRNIKHPVLHYVREHDYTNFVQAELKKPATVFSILLLAGWCRLFLSIRTWTR